MEFLSLQRNSVAVFITPHSGNNNIVERILNTVWKFATILSALPLKAKNAFSIGFAKHIRKGSTIAVPNRLNRIFAIATFSASLSMEEDRRSTATPDPIFEPRIRYAQL